MINKRIFLIIKRRLIQQESALMREHSYLRELAFVKTLRRTYPHFSGAYL